MHVGIIPDGNRRWRKVHGKDSADIIHHHVKTLLTLLVGYRDLCAIHPEIKDVEELSLYMLSKDNLEKRNDTTQDMVFGMIEHIYPVALLICLGSMLHASIRGNLVFVDLARYTSEVSETLRSLCPPDAATVRFYLGTTVKVTDTVLEAFGLPDEWVTFLAALGRKDDDSEGRKDDGFVICCQGDKNKSDLIVPHEELDDATSVPDETNATTHVSECIPHLVVDFIGELDMLPPRIKQVLDDLRRATAMTLSDPGRRGSVRVNVAVAYDPIADVRRCLASQDTDKRRNIDVVIRTSGEMRSSGFFPMQTMYSEWHYHPKLFPDFGVADFVEAVQDFKKRDRRFGQ